MTVIELVVLTLRNMNEDTDDKTIAMYKQEIILYCNLAYLDLMVQRLKVNDVEALQADDDEPRFDASLHYILADYAAYRMFLKGSRQRQQRGEAFYSSYLMGVSKLVSELPTVTVHKFGGADG